MKKMIGFITVLIILLSVAFLAETNKQAAKKNASCRDFAIYEPSSIQSDLMRYVRISKRRRFCR